MSTEFNAPVRPEKTAVKSSVIKTRKKDRNSLENSSDEKKKRMKELISQTLNKPTVPTQVQASTKTKCKPPANVEAPPAPPSKILRNSAQSRLKKISQQKKAENESKKVLQQKKAEKISSAPNQTSQPKPQNQSSAACSMGLPEEKRPPSQLLAKYKIPVRVDQPPAAVIPSSRGTAPSHAPSSTAVCASPTQFNDAPVSFPATRPQNSKGNAQSTSSSKAALPIPKATTSNPHPKATCVPPEVQRNLFRRKTPGCANSQNPSEPQQNCSREDLRTQNLPYKRPQAKPKPPSNESSWWSSVTKTCKDVVDAVKGHIANGTERFSSYSTGRPNVSKQLQNVRTLVEPVEMMDYEISCPTFESEPVGREQTDLHIVIDTNVVLDNLALIRSLKFRKVKGMTPKIIIPWQVLKELDYLKENKNKLDSMKTKVGARQGIRFLLDEIINSDGFIGGQPQHVASRDFTDFNVEVPDDHLIKCCLQLNQAGYNVLLLTNDKNLVIKAVVSNVSSMRCDEFSTICRDSEENIHRPVSCFETPPVGEYSGNQLNIVNAAHRVIILLRGFLSAVLKKFWLYKFHNLWKLRSPGEEPWPLTTLLEIAYETWDEISCDQSQSNPEMILYLRRFIHKVNYEKMVYQDLDQLGRICHHLATSLPSSFGAEGITFDHSLAFLKCTEESGPPADASFTDSCVSLTVHHFQLFENKAVRYCYSISQIRGVPFSYPKISPTFQSDASIDNLTSHLRIISNIEKSLVRVSSSPIGEITKSSEAAQTIHSALCIYLGELADYRFVLQDVVEFCNDANMRTSFTTALQNLETLSTFLELFNRR